MKLVQLLQLFALTFATVFLSASDTPETRMVVDPSDLFMADGKIVVYQDGRAIELITIRMDEGEEYFYLPQDVKCELPRLDKSRVHSEDRRHHCRKCTETFSSAYELDRHMMYDHYNSGTRRR